MFKFSDDIKIPLETGRWQNIPKEERLCSLCDLNVIGDEFHYLFMCRYQEIKKGYEKYIFLAIIILIQARVRCKDYYLYAMYQ